MSAEASIPDDLLLIMQSYVDPLPQTFSDNPLNVGRQQSSPVESAVANEPTNHEHTDEDEVELAIQVESTGEDLLYPLENEVGTPLAPAKDDQEDSSSDSDSSESSSDVEMRVTRYPTRAKQVASLAVLTGPNDSDVEDDEDVPAGSVIQYSGTKNEIMLPEVQSPELTQVPPDDVLEQMGEVMTIIDSVVVVRGHTSGFNRVLDTDSLLVFDDRKVLGLLFETFGAVKQPLYSVRFPSAAAIDKNAVWIGRPVYHVPTRSNFVFTEEIARIKGSDASNLHDEEVGEDQVDFSDDEAEAQWRRNRKEAKREQTLSSGSMRNPAREMTPKQPKLEFPSLLPYPAADDGDVPYSALPYDDMADPRPAPAAYDPYSDHEGEPKASPSMSSRSEPSSLQTSRSENESRGFHGRGKERGRGRGDHHRREGQNEERGRPRRGRGGRGRGRGDRRQGRVGNFPSNQYTSGQYPAPSSTFYSMANVVEQYPYDQFASQDEEYSPVNAANNYWEQGTMPHINPRFFSGEVGADTSAGFGMQWSSMDMPSYNYGYQQSGFGYGGYDQGNAGGYDQNYGDFSYWTPSEQFYPSQNHTHPRGRG